VEDRRKRWHFDPEREACERCVVVAFARFEAV
jgi:hypothetical protein